jgi:hypothetical protein
MSGIALAYEMTRGSCLHSVLATSAEGNMTLAILDREIDRQPHQPPKDSNMIADRIREAGTEQEVFSLLNAYVEAIGGSEKARYLPQGMVSSPDSVVGLMQRCLGLMGEIDAASKRLDDRACAALREALHVFSSALNHLKWLEHETRRSSIDSAAAHETGNSGQGSPHAIDTFVRNASSSRYNDSRLRPLR